MMSLESASEDDGNVISNPVLGYIRQLVTPEISEMLQRQDIYPSVVSENVTDEKLMKILDFTAISPLEALCTEDRRILVKNMRCSLCGGVPPPLPKHCTSGHWMCSDCFRRVPFCPFELFGEESQAICNRPVIHTWGWDTEKYTKIYNKLKVQCKHRKVGCNALIRTNHIKSHEKRCIFRQVNEVSAVVRVFYDKSFLPLLHTKLDTTPGYLHFIGKHATLSVYQKGAKFSVWLSFTSAFEIKDLYYTVEFLQFHPKNPELGRRIVFQNLLLPDKHVRPSSIINERNCAIVSFNELGQFFEARLKRDTNEYYFFVKVTLQPEYVL